tara:strand:- start:1726 stop:2109 length:384 start_codon:yes stop_codon:yes gene_type:complete
MKEEIDIIIKNRDWNFSDISNLKQTIESIYIELKTQLSGSQKLDLVWDMNVTFDGNFGDSFNEIVKIKLSADIAERITVLLKKAKVVFNQNETTENKVPQETESVILEPKDNSTAKTRVGNIKVNRV